VVCARILRNGAKTSYTVSAQPPISTVPRSVCNVQLRNNVITVRDGTVRIGRRHAAGKTVRGDSWIVRRRSRARIAAVRGVA